MRDLEKELRERDQRIDDLLETIRQQAEEVARWKGRVAELEAVVDQRKETNASKPPKFSGNDSLGGQEKQRSGRRKKTSPGRQTSQRDQQRLRIAATEFAGVDPAEYSGRSDPVVPNGAILVSPTIARTSGRQQTNARFGVP